MKKIDVIFVVVLLLLSAIGYIRIRLAEATGASYIRADVSKGSDQV